MTTMSGGTLTYVYVPQWIQPNLGWMAGSQNLSQLKWANGTLRERPARLRPEISFYVVIKLPQRHLT
jgi:hypothetical protein